MKPLKNVAASVHQRLLNLARQSGRPFNELEMRPSFFPSRFTESVLILGRFAPRPIPALLLFKWKELRAFACKAATVQAGELLGSINDQK